MNVKIISGSATTELTIPAATTRAGVRAVQDQVKGLPAGDFENLSVVAALTGFSRIWSKVMTLLPVPTSPTFVMTTGR